MKKIILIVLFLMVPSISVANITNQDLGNFNTLSDAQKAKIISDIAKLKEENINPISKIKIYEDYIELGKAIGSGAGAAAKELNIATNEFIKTTAGKITIGFIAYKVIGKDILQIILGFILWISGSFIIIWSYRRLCLRRVYYPRIWNKLKEIQEFRPVYDPDSSDHGIAATLHAAIFVILNLVFIIAIFNMN